MSSEINIRGLAVETLTELDRGRKNASEAMHAVLRNYQYLSKQERSFYTRLCEGTIEYRLQLDYLINQVSRTPVEKCRPYIRNLLRMSLYQIRYMDRIPPEAACNEAVKLAKKKGFQHLSSFVNGVLRNLIRQQAVLSLPQKKEDPCSYYSVTYSMPEWLVERLLCWYPEDIVEDMLDTFLAEAPLTVRVNQIQGTREAVKKALEQEGIQAEDGYYTENTLRLSGINYMNRIRSFRQGLITVQDESSVLQGCLLKPQADSRILDVCAAPGGKSLYAAEQLYLTGHAAASAGCSSQSLEMSAGLKKLVPGSVMARDISEKKVEQIIENTERMKIPNLRTEVWNALQSDPDCEDQADIVIADLPCSGLGVLGRKADIKYRLDSGQIKELVCLQREILTTVIPYIRYGGRLLYSTCTVNPEENEEQVWWMRKQFGLEPVNIRDMLPASLVQELSDQPGTDLEGGYATLLPGRQHCDGFFLAALYKPSEG